MLYFNEKPHDPVTLALYPDGNTSFEMYEDDGVTRAHEQGVLALFTTVRPSTSEVSRPGTIGAFAKTEISMSAAANFSSGKHERADVNVTVKAYTGKGYEMQPTSRRWTLEVHSPHPPLTVLLQNGSSSTTVIPACNSMPQVDYLPMGWTWQHFSMENGTLALKQSKQ